MFARIPMPVLFLAGLALYAVSILVLPPAPPTAAARGLAIPMSEVLNAIDDSFVSFSECIELYRETGITICGGYAAPISH